MGPCGASVKFRVLGVSDLDSEYYIRCTKGGWGVRNGGGASTWPLESVPACVTGVPCAPTL